MLSSDGSDRLMLHCGHAFDHCELGGIQDVKAYQGTQFIGRAIHGDASRDIAVVGHSDDDDGVTYSDRIEDGNGPVEGRVTESGLQDIMGESTEVYKVGVSTCRESGLVLEMYRSRSLNCASDNNHYVKFSTHSEGGDSGSPHFHETVDPTTNEPYVAMIGVHSRGGSDASTYSIGCAAYDIYDEYGYMFT